MNFAVEEWEAARNAVQHVFPRAFASVTTWAVRIFRGEDGELWGQPLSYVEIAEGLGQMTVPTAWLRALEQVKEEQHGEDCA